MALKVTGIFNDTEQAKQAVENLITSGFTYDCIDEGNDTRNYTHAADRAWVITVRTEIDELVKLAAGILDESGAVDIEKKAAEYGFGGEIVFDVSPILSSGRSGINH